MDKIVGFIICGAIVVGAQLLAVQVYEAWWDSETAVPESTIQFITLIVSFGLSWLILKAWPDEPS